jgi:hypothetical protein
MDGNVHRTSGALSSNGRTAHDRPDLPQPRQIRFEVDMRACEADEMLVLAQLRLAFSGAVRRA